MCSEGVSVWFACKLCKSFFLNADDFAYHKKKSHVQEFRITKFIVFEEQTSPTASPPENWVSFLPPKEEIQIHKIISSPTPSTTTNANYKSPSESTLSKRDQEFIEMDPENEKDCNDNIQDGRSEDAAKASNNSLDSINKNTVQSAIQSQHEPYVCLKRLKCKKSRNLSSYSNNSNSTVQSKFNCSSNNNLNTSSVVTVNKPKVTASGDEETFNIRSSAISSPPLPAFEECNLENVNSTAEPNIHEDICHLKRQFANILCVPCLLTFSSSDELNAHNLSFHSTSTSTALTSDLYYQRTNLTDNLQVTPKTKVSPNQNQEGNISSNEKLNLDPVNLEVNFSPGDLLETVKTEYTDGYEDIEFSATGVDHDPLNFESRVESSFAEKEIPSIAGSSSSLVDSDGNHGKLPLQAELSRKCVSCKQYFASFQELKSHNKNHHMTQGGKLRFKCPHSNCVITARDQYVLGIHLMQVHSNARLFKCPHSDCKKSFKTTKSRNGHFNKCHKKPLQSRISKKKSIK